MLETLSLATAALPLLSVAAALGSSSAKAADDKVIHWQLAVAIKDGELAEVGGFTR